MKISAVVLTKNEEKNIGRCLRSLAWCDEIVLIDDYSEDKTREIAKRYKARVYRRHLSGDFAGQRNFGLGKAKNEWVLFVDADEIVPAGLAEEIINHKLQTSNFKGFYIRRRDFWWGKEMKYGEAGGARFMRLAKKNAGEWKRRVHETWEVKGEIGSLRAAINHYPHQSLGEFIEHINFQSQLHARELTNPTLAKIVFYPVGKFVYNYFVRLGFLDGMRGLVHALMMSGHSFLAWSKAWLS